MGVRVINTTLFPSGNVMQGEHAAETINKALIVQLEALRQARAHGAESVNTVFVLSDEPSDWDAEVTKK